MSRWAQQLLPAYVLREIPETLFGTSAVYRLLFALCIFHVLMGLITCGVHSSRDPRAYIQDGFWFVKLAVLIGLIIGSFYIPATALTGIGWTALIAAGFFILVQLLLLVNFACDWNDRWVAKWHAEDDKRWYYGLIASTGGLYVVVLVLSIVLYAVFCSNSEGGCVANIAFITVNILAVLAISGASISPAVQASNPSSGLLQAAMVGAYSTYLVASALLSEGDTWACHYVAPYGSEHARNVSLTAGAILTLVSVCYSALRVTQNSEAFGGGDVEINEPTADEEEGVARGAPKDDEEEAVVYSYAFFHYTLAVAAAYVMMLLTNWVVIDKSQDGGLTVNSGTAAVWVKMASSWCALGLYTWTLVAPVIFPDREFA